VEINTLTLETSTMKPGTKLGIGILAGCPIFFSLVAIVATLPHGEAGADGGPATAQSGEQRETARPAKPRGPGKVEVPADGLLTSRLEAEEDGAVTVDEILTAFEANEAAATKKYASRVISIRGRVERIQMGVGAARSGVNLGSFRPRQFQLNLNVPFIFCAMPREKMENVKKGSAVTYRGWFWGWNGVIRENTYLTLAVGSKGPSGKYGWGP
jgi:hypothetical protein